MTYQMVANRLLYRPEEARECAKGEVFTVETEAEKNRLLRSNRASMHEPKSPSIKSMKPPRTETRSPPVINKVMKAEDPAPAAVPPAQKAEPAPPAPAASDSAATQDPAPAQEPASADETNPTTRSNRYRRSDLRPQE